MPPTLQKHKLYQTLGHLFYAIAAADKVVRPKEVDALKKIIETDWLPAENAKIAILQMQITFDQLVEQRMEAKTAMDVFKFFKYKNKSLFTDEINKQIWKTVNTIAESVSGKNKSELILLSQLSVLLKS